MIMDYFWWFLSAFVHTQTIILLIALLPYPTSKQWYWIVNNSLVSFFRNSVGFSVWGFYLAVLCPCLMVHLDSMWSVAHWLEKETLNDEESISLFTSQRNYFISGTAMILCMQERHFKANDNNITLMHFFLNENLIYDDRVIPRVIAIRGENANMAEHSESFLKKLIKELLHVVREVDDDMNETEDDTHNRNRRHNRNHGVYNRDCNCNETNCVHILESIQKELERINRARGNIEDHVLQEDELRLLSDFYNRIKIQNHATNSDGPQQNNQRQRLARSRFSTTAPLRREMNGDEFDLAQRTYHYEFQ